MGSVYKAISTILDLIQTLLSIALAGVSIWFFTELKSLTDLRNRDRYLLDFNVYWPQVLPWLFVVISVIVICVSLCGVYGVCSGKKAAVIIFIAFLIIVSVLAIGAGVLGLICGDSIRTDEFLSETVRDAFSEMKVRQDVLSAFGALESRLRCCGMTGSSDYTSSKIPESCCDKNELVECSNSASRRLGCVEVVTPYSRMFMRYTSIGCLFIGLICLANVVVAILYIRSKRSKNDRLKSEAEKEPLKLPL